MSATQSTTPADPVPPPLPDAGPAGATAPGAIDHFGKPLPADLNFFAPPPAEIGHSFSRPTANRVKCASNLRQIGQAILLCSQDFGGRYPDALSDLLITEDIGSEAFVCPSTADTPATGPTTQVVAANLPTAGHCSYVYLGKGLTQQTVTADMVIAYEPLSNYGGAGMNVLFGDGHVEFFTAGPQTTSLLSQVGAGTWPVRVAWNTSATAAMVPTTQTAPAR